MFEKSIYYILFQAARIIAKLAAWGRELMEGSDLNYYFNWIKTQLSSQVKSYFFLNFTVVSDFFFQEYQCIHVKIRGIFLVLFFLK